MTTGETGTRPAAPAPDPAAAAAVPAGALGALRGLLQRPLASYYLLLASSGLLLVIGLTMVFSATSVHAYATDGNAFANIARQATYAVVGLVAFWAFQRLPVGTFRTLGLPLLLTALTLQLVLDGLSLLHSAELIAAPRIGPVESNLRWLNIAGLSVQPSELAKLALVLWGADVLARKGTAIGWWRELSRPLFPVAAVLMLLVGAQDLGTMLCMLVLFVGLLWAAGVRLRIFAAMSVTALAVVSLLVALRSSYRMERLTSFLSRDCDVLDECYQSVQGRTALADGGWFGVGLGNASLKWGWLPEGHNDFIFAIVGEELGVVGCLVVLALFAVLSYTGLRIARRVDDRFRRLAATGVVSWLVGQTVINIGAVVGLLPITGVPLPFISDGGSALVVTLAAVGMLASFARAEPAAVRALHARPPAHWVRLVWAPLPPLPRPRADRPPAAGRAPAGERRRS
jgi:cell division protein FtsW